LRVLQGYILSAAQDSVEEILTDQFELGVTTKLGTAKRISDLVAAVDGIESISYHHLVLEIRKELQAGYDSFHDYGETLEAVPLYPRGVRLFVGSSEVAVDDGAGNFTTSSSGYVVSGTVDYTTGVVAVDITPAPTDTVYVRYQQDSDGDIEVTNMQICKLYSIDVTNIAYTS
jgi:hypothetical protein